MLVNVKPYRIPEVHKAEAFRQEQVMLKDGVITRNMEIGNRLKGINKTVGISFPIPNISEILDQLSRAKYLTSLDLASGYKQVPIKEVIETKQPSALHMTTNAVWFERTYEDSISWIEWDEILVYLYDIVIYGRTLEEHSIILREVFDRLREHTQKLQPDKCEFLRRKIVYLVHVISNEGVKPDPSYYRKFVQNYINIAKPLFDLLKNEVNYEWMAEHKKVFNTLKQVLTTEPILHLDFAKPFLLTTVAIGAKLYQGEIGKDRSIAYGSRTLNKAERNYSASERKMLSIIRARTKQFIPYLLGRKFTVITDNKPLQWILSVKDAGSRLLRWSLKLEEYVYEIKYRAGKAIPHVDASSRICSNTEIKNTEKNKMLGTRDDSVNKRENPAELNGSQRKQILKEYHDTPIGGHLGKNGMYMRIKQQYWWPNMKKEIYRSTLEKSTLDIVGPYSETEPGNRYLLTCQDDLSKCIVAIPLPAQDAETVVKTLLENEILRFGIRQIILTNNGSNFVSDLMKRLCKLLQDVKNITTCYHPQSNLWREPIYFSRISMTLYEQKSNRLG
ncbi:hypothetical protein PR048_021357 [Dryococelus australis]|uniref:RNA-directed DNA polymerase n=1 Tax=Dryococelus australis TaxID=614101 RepID=A0ABQ9GY50_9NEOP|nr:hypothetical protein PR048_021357 [Dryococelus australis]